jgi:hypothetical protein
MAAAAILGTAIGSAAVAIGRGVAAATGDGLSFAAELLKAAGGAASADQPAADESALAGLKQRISELTQRLQRHLTACGIRLSQPAELFSNGQGGIAVAGGHPQQAAIAEALADDVLLESEFNRLAYDYAEAVGGGESGAMSVVVSPQPGAY